MGKVEYGLISDVVPHAVYVAAESRRFLVVQPEQWTGAMPPKNAPVRVAWQDDGENLASVSPLPRAPDESMYDYRRRMLHTRLRVQIALSDETHDSYLKDALTTLAELDGGRELVPDPKDVYLR